MGNKLMFNFDSPQDDVLGEDEDEDDDEDVSPSVVQQQAIQEDAPAQAEAAVDTIQADATAPEVYEDEQQFGKKSGHMYMVGLIFP